MELVQEDTVREGIKASPSAPRRRNRVSFQDDVAVQDPDDGVAGTEDTGEKSGKRPHFRERTASLNEIPALPLRKTLEGNGNPNEYWENWQIDKNGCKVPDSFRDDKKIVADTEDLHLLQKVGMRLHGEEHRKLQKEDEDSESEVFSDSNGSSNSDEPIRGNGGGTPASQRRSRRTPSMSGEEAHIKARIWRENVEKEQTQEMIDTAKQRRLQRKAPPGPQPDDWEVLSRAEQRTSFPQDQEDEEDETKGPDRRTPSIVAMENMEEGQQDLCPERQVSSLVQEFEEEERLGRQTPSLANDEYSTEDDDDDEGRRLDHHAKLRGTEIRVRWENRQDDDSHSEASQPQEEQDGVRNVLHRHVVSTDGDEYKVEVHLKTPSFSEVV